MNSTELLAHIDRLKRRATARFTAGEREAACADYERGARLLRLVATEDEGALSGEGDLSIDEAASRHALQLALRLNAAACALRGARYEQALVHCDAALVLSPGSTKAVFRRGQALSQLGRLAEAEAAFSAAVELDPTSREANAQLRALRAKTAAPSQPPSQAPSPPVESSPVASAGEPPLGEPPLGSATRGEPPAIVPTMQATGATKVVGVDPGLRLKVVGADPGLSGSGSFMSAGEVAAHVEGLKQAANTRFKAGDIDGACAEYAEATRQLGAVDGMPSTAEEAASVKGLKLALSLNSAQCSLKSGQYEQALEHSDTALQVSSTSLKGHFRRGQALSQLGRLAEAEAAFSAAAEIDPTNRDVQQALLRLRAAS